MSNHRLKFSTIFNFRVFINKTVYISFVNVQLHFHIQLKDIFKRIHFVTFFTNFVLFPSVHSFHSCRPRIILLSYLRWKYILRLCSAVHEFISALVLLCFSVEVETKAFITDYSLGCSYILNFRTLLSYISRYLILFHS